MQLKYRVIPNFQSRDLEDRETQEATMSVCMCLSVCLCHKRLLDVFNEFIDNY